MSDKELRELDAWIAEHVFEWQRQSFDNGHAKHNLLVRDKFRTDKFVKHGWIDGNKLVETFPKYTTDPAAAMLVLEKCCEIDGMDAIVEIAKTTTSWRVFNRDKSKDQCTTFANTLPLAICLFAKKLFTK